RNFLAASSVLYTFDSSGVIKLSLCLAAVVNNNRMFNESMRESFFSCVKNFNHLPTPAESHITKVEQKTGFRPVRKTDVAFYQPTPEESHVYGIRSSSPDQPTPEESHVYRKRKSPIH